MLSRSVLLAIAALSTFGANLVDAAECTDAEWQTSQSIWSWAATTSACAQYAVGDNFVSAPCSATSCVSVMEQVGEQLPDCTASGVNNKVEVLNATTVCNNNALIETNAPNVSPPNAAPLITTAPIVTSAPFQTLTPLTSLAPRPGSSASGTVDTFTTSTTAPTSTPTDSSSSFLTSGNSSTPTPASTASNTSCTTSQVSTLESLYSEAAKTANCAPDASSTSYSIYIYTKCASSCATKLKALAEDLPNCYYNLGSQNQKASLLDQIDDCTGPYHSTYISTTMYLASSLPSSGAVSDTALQIGWALAVVLFAVVGMLL